MPALETLRERDRFEALQRSGQVRSERLLVIRYARNDLGRVRWAFSASRRVGGAVVRNRIRRRLREGAREIHPSVKKGWDIMIIARPEGGNAGTKELRAALAALLERGGLLEAEVE